MTTPIEFAPETAATNSNETTPWTKPKVSTYQDLVIKPEYASRRLRFEPGTTWLRIVPAIHPTIHSWMMGLHVLNFQGGRFAHPKTLQKSARGVFDYAYTWAKEHHPESLYSKENKTGVRLLTDPMCIYWALVEQEGKTVARLVLGSGYDGTRGGAPGLGYQLWSLTHEHDENGKVVSEPAHPERGALVSVTRTQAKGAKYPSYGLRLGRQPAPVNSQLAKMAPEEVAALCPLENVVRQLSIEEEWQCLAKVIAPDIVTKIRSDIEQ